jgi:phospholipase C
MSATTNPIEHIVVVMLENRSYDNMLGGLYNPHNAPPYDRAPAGQADLNGLGPNPGATWSNPDQAGQPVPVHNQTTDTSTPSSDPIVSGFLFPATSIPIIDPGETFGDMAWQITGSSQTSNPYTTWPPSNSSNNMRGFVADYQAQVPIGKTTPIVPPENVPDVMNYFNPSQVPVTAWLANNFAVCDNWYASVPTQTFTNRVFAHCAAPGVILPQDTPP